MIVLNWTAEVEYHDAHGESYDDYQEWTEIVVKVNGHDVARCVERSFDDDDTERIAANLIIDMLDAGQRR